MTGDSCIPAGYDPGGEGKDMTVCSNYALTKATLRFVRRVRDENPGLWKRIQQEAAEYEAAQAALAAAEGDRVPAPEAAY